MTKLAPARIAGLMMGVWFLATSVGNFIARPAVRLLRSDAAARASSARSPLFAIVAGIIMFLLVPWMKRLMGEVN